MAPLQARSADVNLILPIHHCPHRSVFFCAHKAFLITQDRRAIFAATLGFQFR